MSITKVIKNNQERFLFGIIIILIAAISFRAGEVREKERESSEIKVNINNQEPLSLEDKEIIALGKAVQRKGLSETVEIQEKLSNNEEDCQYIGSINSDKYHTMSCRWAKQIKPENRVCFKSIEDAEKRGYKPGSCNNN